MLNEQGGPDGWPEAFEYSAGGRAVRFADEVVPGVRPVLHLKLFNPVNDHYGFSPIEAAATAIDIHNTASKWTRIDKATFLTQNEKRSAVGYGPAEVSDPPGLTPADDALNRHGTTRD